MNLQNGRGSVSTASSSGAWKSGETVPDQFPAGLRVLVVDDDPTCLMILEKMLRTCLYEVTKCNRAEIALSLLRENKNGYDVVISDVHMPDMDGFKLLEYIGLEMDLPVIMMSADDGKSVVMKGVTHGACDYLIKPVRIEALKNIWQHVVRKKKNEWKDVEQSEMNLQNGRGSVSMASSSGAWKSGETVPDQFPAGLRVLVVDDDPTCLMILEKMLRTCLYEVTKCNRAEIALSLLRENKNGYDVVISDVHMPDMDGFKLLEYIGLEMDLPVIMMSADDGKSVVMKGVTHGACDYLIKPVRIEALKNIWQHVVRKKKNEWKDVEQSGSVDEGYRQQKPCDEPDYSSSANEGNWKNSKKRKDEDEDAEDRDDTSTLKKPRVVWSLELHQQFVGAVNQLGIDKAVPKKILELMNVPGLTRENVASHLQKYRLYLRRLSGVSQHQSNLSNSFISSQEASFGAMSSLNGIDLQTLAATGQLPAQSLATLKAAGLGRSTAKSGIPMPLVDQRNLFSFENPKLRFAEGQQHHSSGKPMNLLHGIPTTMEAKQLANLHQSAQSLGAVNMQVNPHGVQNSSLYMIGQPQSRGQIMNESTGTHVPRLPSSIGQPMVSNGIPTGVIGRNGISDGGRGTGYNPVPQNSSMLNFPLNNTPELTGNSYTLGSTQGVRAKTCNATCNLAQGHESSPWLVACVQSGSFVISIFLVFILFSLALLGFLMFPPAK